MVPTAGHRRRRQNYIVTHGKPHPDIDTNEEISGDELMHKEVTEEEELKVKQQKTVKNEFFFCKIRPHEHKPHPDIDTVPETGHHLQSYSN